MAAASASAASWRSRSAASVAVRRSARLSAKGTARAATARRERITRTTRTRRPMSDVQPKTEPTHRLKRKSWELGPDLSDEEVQRAGPAHHRGAPNLEHQFLTADRLTLAGSERRQELELGSGERLRISVQGHFPAFAVDGHRARDDRPGGGSRVARDTAQASHDG